MNCRHNGSRRCFLIVALCGAGFAFAPAGAEEIRFSENLISNDYGYAYGIGVADLDRDGDFDLTSANAMAHASTQNCLYWFENDGTGNFKRHLIAKEDPGRLERHQIADINRDGSPDVVIVENQHGHVLWYQNSGRPGDGQPWKRHHIAKGNLPGAYDVAVADLDRDNDLDVAASSWSLGNQFAWFENDGSPTHGAWTKHTIEENIAETRTVRAADFDGDGDLDLLGTASADGLVVWYENSGKPAPGPWKRHGIDTAGRPLHGEPVDLDGDGDEDVVLALGMSGQPGRQQPANQIAWYENAGKEGWKKHVIRAPFEDGFEAVAADLDGDGDIDVVATSWRKPGRLVWFENAGDPKDSWTMHLLKGDWHSANQVVVADLNGDGRLDIAAVAERGSLEFRWWRNEGPAAKSTTPAQ